MCGTHRILKPPDHLIHMQPAPGFAFALGLGDRLAGHKKVGFGTLHAGEPAEGMSELSAELAFAAVTDHWVEAVWSDVPLSIYEVDPTEHRVIPDYRVIIALVRVLLDTVHLWLPVTFDTLVVPLLPFLPLCKLSN